MGKKSKLQKLNADTETTKIPGPTPETPINGSDQVVVSKKPWNHKSSVRRSGRLQSVIKPLQNQVVEQIDLEESEKEDNENHVQPLSIVSEPCHQESGDGPTLSQKIRDERVDLLVKTVEEFKSKHFTSESSSVGLIYKSLYLDSQKKIEALTSENHELARKLEIVLAKLEVYENMNKSTEAVIVSNLEKAIETLVRPLSHFGGHGADADVAKKESAKKRRHDHVI